LNHKLSISSIGTDGEADNRLTNVFTEGSPSAGETYSFRKPTSTTFPQIA